MIKAFDNESTHLSEVATIKAQTLHKVEMYRKVCENIREYLKSLDVCIKELRRCMTKEKALYGKFILSHDFIKDILDELAIQLVELKTFVTELQSPNL